MFYIFNKDGRCIAHSDYETNLEDHAIRSETVIESDIQYHISNIELVNNEISIKEVVRDLEAEAIQIRNALRRKIDVFLLPAATYKDELVEQSDKDMLIQDSVLLAKWPKAEGWPNIPLPDLSSYAKSVLTLPEWPPQE